MAHLEIIAATAFGLEAVVARELANLGFESRTLSTGRVLFQGTERAVCDANLWLRSADRVLIRVGHFPAKDFDTLFEQVQMIEWERWVGRDGAFPVNGRSVRSQLSSVPALQRTVKRGIVERLRRAHGVSGILPETGPRVTVEVALLDDTATITIDTSGDGLHKRGYRPFVGEAALKETLAAGLVQLSVWRPDRPLVDPFCGSGTIVIEAAMIARNIAPGLARRFDAEAWPAFSSQTWNEARDMARAKAGGKPAYTIHASDIDDRALALARRCAGAAGVDRDIHFARRSFEELAPKAEYGCIITNPPYGVRLGDDVEVERLYRTFPTVLRRMPTWSFHILTARQDLEALVGQKATRRRKLFNSQIECTYFTFLGPRPPKQVAPGEPGQPLAREDEADFGDAMNLADVTTFDGVPAARPDPGTPAEPIDGRREAGDLDAPAGPAPVSTPAPTRGAHPGAPAFGGLRERDLREAAEFGACLVNNARHLRRYPSRGITCYRVYERDVPDVPLIVDRYEDWVHVAEYEREHSRTIAQQADWYDLMRDTIARSLGVPADHVCMKQKHRQRGLTQHEKQGEQGAFLTVHEGGLRFLVNLTDYIDTGLFLDHRLTRAMFREQAAGKRVLNLFCYTASFSVYAAAGGAASTTSVDLSNTYLEWAQKNLSINGLWPGRHRLVRSDVLEFLRDHPRGEHYDLVVVDPPTFSNSKSTEEDWEVAVGHTEVLTRLAPLLSPDGSVYFSTNYRRFKMNEDALAAAGLAAREISNRTVPPEYRNKRIHRCWRLRHAEAERTSPTAT